MRVETDPRPADTTDVYFSTQQKRRADALVKQHCANYIAEYGECGIFRADCAQLTSQRIYCKYFEHTVLPLDAALQAELEGDYSRLRKCEVCGKAFVPSSNRAKYCGEKCAHVGNRKRNTALQRKRRDVMS